MSDNNAEWTLKTNNRISYLDKTSIVIHSVQTRRGEGGRVQKGKMLPEWKKGEKNEFATQAWVYIKFFLFCTKAFICLTSNVPTSHKNCLKIKD